MRSWLAENVAIPFMARVLGVRRNDVERALFSWSYDDSMTRILADELSRHVRCDSCPALELCDGGGCSGVLHEWAARESEKR